MKESAERIQYIVDYIVSYKAKIETLNMFNENRNKNNDMCNHKCTSRDYYCTNNILKSDTKRFYGFC